MAEVVIFAIVMVVLTVAGQLKKAKRKGQTQFKWPTPKSWQLPGPTQPPAQTFQAGTPPPMPQVIQQLPGNWPTMPQQVVQPMPGTRPSMPQQVVQPVQGYVPPQQAAGWMPAPVAPQLPPQFRQQPPPHHRPQQNPLPASQDDLDERVRRLMAKNNEVGAVRLLCDEAELGIIEAQQYARSLVAPADTPATSAAPIVSAAAEERWSGSAAFGTSTFEREHEDVWASGWVDEPDPDDRSDVDELWNTVRNAGKPPA